MNPQNQFRGIVRVGLVVALVCALGVASTRMVSTTGADHASAAMRNLEGTWRVQVTVVDCATGAEAPPFWSLLTFARGGTLTETTANQALPAPRTPGHGVWDWTGPASFFATSEAFLLFGPGFAPWTQRIEQTIVMTSDDEFDSDARVTFSVTPSHLQPAQNPPPAPGCARARGFRF